MTGVFQARTGLMVLDRDGCLELLRQEEVGRLAIVEGGHPLVFPVNYVLDGEDIVFRTAEGTKLSAGVRGPVCFEVDNIERSTHTGWSVIVSGRLEEVTKADGARLQRLQALPVEPWAPGLKDHWMRVVARSITGRQIPKR